MDKTIILTNAKILAKVLSRQYIKLAIYQLSFLIHLLYYQLRGTILKGTHK